MMAWLAIAVCTTAALVWLAAWLLFRGSRPPSRTPDRSDYLEMLEAIDAEILDLYDERADIVQQLRKLGSEGRA